jgi:hypothetical protein
LGGLVDDLIVDAVVTVSAVIATGAPGRGGEIAGGR